MAVGKMKGNETALHRLIEFVGKGLLEDKITPAMMTEYRLPSEAKSRAKSLAKEEKKNTDPVDWIQENFYLYDTGKLISLFDCQERPLRLALSKDDKGNFNYSTILWSWPKKSAKSSVIAAVVDYTAWNKSRSIITLTGNDQRQADSRVGMYIRENLRLSPRRDRVKITPSGYKIEYDNGSKIEMVPIDPSGEAGGNQDLMVFSELWGWKSQAHQNMWAELTISPNRFGKAQRWIDTYAGFVGQSPVLEGLYSSIFQSNGVLTEGSYRVWPDLEVYANDGAKLLCVWVTKPMLPWQTAEYYAQQEADLPSSQFLRLHRNQWVTSSDSFLPDISWWQNCQRPLAPLTDKEDLIIAVDGAASNDNFGIVGVVRKIEYAKDGTITSDVTQVKYARRWEPPKGGQIQFSNVNNPMDRNTPEGELRYLCANYNVIVVAYDPMQLVDMMQRFKQENLVYCKPFSQQQERLKADRQLRDNIRDRVIEHDGNTVLTEHLMNADAAIDGDTENKLRIVKRSDSGKIDLAVCLSMANYVARKWNL